jgi:hypothetical protein
MRCASEGSQPRWGAGGRRAARLAAGLLAGLALATVAHGVAIDMTEVRRIAQQPVQAILRDTPFRDIADADYRQKVQGSSRPVIVVFYADRDEKSRNLATLARYLAVDFSDKIGFYGYRATDAAAVDKPRLAHLQKGYGVRQVPATLFYDNDTGKMELEGTRYDVPTLTEYRTPSLLFFKTYYGVIHKYISESILD